jgi:hypothetical protein
LDIEGNRGSSLLGTGSKFSFSPVEDSCETNSLLQSTVIQIFGHSPFNKISNPEYPAVWPLKELQNLQKYFDSFAKHSQWKFFLFFPCKCIWHMSEHHRWRHICEPSKLFTSPLHNSNIPNMRYFSHAMYM